MHAGKLIFLFLLLSIFSLHLKGQYDFSANDTTGCASPFRVKFAFASTASVDTVESYFWSFGNGETSTLQDPDSVTYTETGKYDIALHLQFSDGGEQWILKEEYVLIQSIDPTFEYHIGSGSYLSYQFDHTGVLDTAWQYDYDWDIENIGMVSGAHQDVNFTEADTVTVILTVTDEFGCSASSSMEIFVLDEIYIPNVFSPDNDEINGINDNFIIESSGVPLRLRIFSRTGIMVFQDEGTVVVWDGRTATGEKLKTGVYYYTLEALSGDPDKLYSKAGFLHLFRKE